VESSQWGPSGAAVAAGVAAAAVAVAVAAAATVVVATAAAAAAALQGSEFCVGAYGLAGTARSWVKSRANSRGSKLRLDVMV
jgi:uncharacterized RmlC-like cupin family protein